MAQVRYGIIGCGNIGPIHAQAIKDVRGAKLIAVSDIVEATAKKLAGEHGADPYTDYKKMLARDDLDAVCVCVPSGLRLGIAKDCAAAGKHILSEKPLEVTTKRVDQIINATDKAGVLLGCIFQSRFADDSLLVRKAIDQGRFGKFVFGDAYVKWFRSKEYYDSAAWRGTKKLDGGGALMNQSIHYIDLLLWFMGPVKRLRAQTGNILHKRMETEDTASAILEFKNGAQGVIQGSTAIWPGHPARMELHGTEGSVVMEDGKIKLWKFSKRKPIDKKIEADMGRDSELGSGAADPLSSLKTEGHRRQIQDFTIAIQKKRKPIIEGREGRLAVNLIESIYKSAATGRTITF